MPLNPPWHSNSVCDIEHWNHDYSTPEGNAINNVHLIIYNIAAISIQKLIWIQNVRLNIINYKNNFYFINIIKLGKILQKVNVYKTEIIFVHV